MSRIVAATLRSLRVPFRLRQAIASGDLPAASGQLLLELESDDGIVGRGDVAPLYAHFGTPEETRAAFWHHALPHVLGRDVFDVATIIGRLERALPHNTYARSMVDLALYDLMGRTLGVPIYKLLGGKRMERVPLVWTVFLGEPARAAEEAAAYAAQGFRSFKVKIGTELDADVRRVEAVRRAVGPECHLWVDCNQGYTVKEAIRVARAIERFAPLGMEQPVRRFNLTGLAQVARAVDVPILTDESSHTPEQALELIRQRAVDAFSHKISRSAGLYRSQQMLALAEAAGMPVVLAASTGSLATAAGAHFYTANPVIRYGAELVPPLWLERVLRPGDLQIEQGAMRVPEAPGLGVEPDPEAVERYADGEPMRAEASPGVFASATTP